MNKKPPEAQQLDLLLADGLLKAPSHFNRQMVDLITQQATTDATARNIKAPVDRYVTTSLWQWLALGSASLIGTIQMTGFIFGVWIVTAAG